MLYKHVLYLGLFLIIQKELPSSSNHRHSNHHRQGSSILVHSIPQYHNLHRYPHSHHHHHPQPPYYQQTSPSQDHNSWTPFQLPFTLPYLQNLFSSSSSASSAVDTTVPSVSYISYPDHDQQSHQYLQHHQSHHHHHPSHHARHVHHDPNEDAAHSQFSHPLSSSSSSEPYFKFPSFSPLTSPRVDLNSISYLRTSHHPLAHQQQQQPQQRQQHQHLLPQPRHQQLLHPVPSSSNSLFPDFPESVSTATTAKTTTIPPPLLLPIPQNQKQLNPQASIIYDYDPKPAPSRIRYPESHLSNYVSMPSSMASSLSPNFEPSSATIAPASSASLPDPEDFNLISFQRASQANHAVLRTHHHHHQAPLIVMPSSTSLSPVLKDVVAVSLPPQPMPPMSTTTTSTTTPAPHVITSSHIEMCGKPRAKPRSRIIGGQDAFYGEFPWQVHIKIAKHQCGGALVNRDFVVTAAHCVYQAPLQQLSIIIGAYDIEDHRFQEDPPQFFSVSEVRLHPNFRFSASHPDRYDVAVLKLDKAARYSDNVLPVCLPPAGVSFEGWYGVVTGWGKTDPALSNRYGTRLLQKVDVPIIRNPECENWHHTRGIDLKIFPEMFCAGYEDGRKDACVGDSGGPLVVFLNNRWTLAGITSAGFGCAQSRQPGIYHRLPVTVDWVTQNIVN